MRAASYYEVRVEADDASGGGSQVERAGSPLEAVDVAAKLMRDMFLHHPRGDLQVSVALRENT